IAKAVDADGVHLGLQDTGIDEARKIIGKEKIIGGTANTLDDVLQRYNEGCSYVGVGPYRFTTTKEKLSPILGLQGYADI
ncbi:thiamine phosphate synthase, partial [Acinetobacter baumannii]